MKKFTSLFLALALCMGLAVPALAAELKSDKYTYTLSNEPMAAERVFNEPQYDDDGNFIEMKEVTRTVYLVPDGTSEKPAGKAGGRPRRALSGGLRRRIRAGRKPDAYERQGQHPGLPGLRAGEPQTPGRGIHRAAGGLQPHGELRASAGRHYGDPQCLRL